MKKLYKQDNAILLYAEYWIDQEKQAVIIHTGKVGKTGETEEINLNNFSGSVEKAETFFFNKYKPLGFSELADLEKYEIVVQYKMKSLQGNKRDHWLRDKVSDYLNHELGWNGLGYVDGYDMRKMISDDQKFVLNIYCIVVDEEKGIAAIKRCLREYCLDYTQVKIASKPYLSEIPYQLKYSPKKNNQTFSI